MGTATSSPRDKIPQNECQLKAQQSPKAAEHLGTGERFVRRLIAQRRIPFIKLSKHVRVERSAMDHFIDAGRVPSQ